jgi:RNA polymerase sigma factor (sigma-70 family)
MAATGEARKPGLEQGQRVVQPQPDRPSSARAEVGQASDLPVMGGGTGAQRPRDRELGGRESAEETEDTHAAEVLAARPPVEVVPADALARAQRLSQSLDHPLLSRVLATPGGPELQSLNNALMDAFRLHANLEAFSLLFELNTRPFSVIANRILRMTGSRADIGDILQETFLAIYRYPSRFCPDKPNAFRNWSYSIIRNTVYRHLQMSNREGIPVDFASETLPDEHAATPSDASEDAEADRQCERVYGMLLCLYNDIYERDLKPRDRLALRLVEVERLGYREAAEQLGIRLENFKMIVCRARKKIFQSLVRTLGTRKS